MYIYIYISDYHNFIDKKIAYRRGHSTETVQLRVFSDLIGAMDQRISVTAIFTWPVSRIRYGGSRHPTNAADKFVQHQRKVITMVRLVSYKSDEIRVYGGGLYVAAKD